MKHKQITKIKIFIEKLHMKNEAESEHKYQPKVKRTVSQRINTAQKKAKLNEMNE